MLRDIATALEKNVRRSWQMILWPNGFCAAGAFFLYTESQKDPAANVATNANVTIPQCTTGR